MEFSRSLILSASIASILSGCATLPAPEAVAFNTLAQANKDAFEGQINENAKGRLAIAQSLMRAGEGRVVVDGCGASVERDVSGQNKPCRLSYELDGLKTDFKPLASNTRALLGSIVRYSASMKTLAEAKDLDEVKAKAEAAAGSVKALTLVVAPAAAIAGPIIDAVVFAGNAALKEKRRNALRKNALAAAPAVSAVVASLTTISEQLSSNIQNAKSLQIIELQERIKEDAREETALSRAYPRYRGGRPDVAARIDALRERRQGNLALLVDAQDGIEKARKPLDFSSLESGHRAVIAKLENPKESIEDAVRDFNTFLTIVDDLVEKSKNQTEAP
ncbi:hypothetical protein BH10PLA2_BH10PLA2_00250 [soil metagenome]